MSAKTPAELFFQEITSRSQRDNSTSLTLAQYNSYVAYLQSVPTKSYEKRNYSLERMYCLVPVNGVDKLARRIKHDHDNIKYVVPNEHMYEILLTEHIKFGHPGQTNMYNDIKPRYSNVTQEIVRIFLKYCEKCQQKRNAPAKKSTTIIPIRSKTVNERWQADLIDKQHDADGEFTQILVVQDHLTKFVQLIALKQKTAVDVAAALTRIFT